MDAPSSSLPVVNAAAYHFAPLDQLRALRARLQARCRELALKGTILLSSEGVNLFIAGAEQSVEALLAELRAVPGLAPLAAKYSRTAEQPFRRMLVRLKKEIIAFGVPGIDPARHTSPRLTARELREWIAQGRRFTLLDTRNDYEVKLGTFRGALPIGVNHFREFPEAVARLPEALKQQPVVTFCTGGIRCEKAAPYLETQGFREVYQLDGGILKYFEECGGEHYDGDCFVFDRRVGLDPALQETAAAQCFHCLAPLSEADQADPRHVPGESCPHCHVTPAARQEAALAARRTALAQLLSPLPGSVPEDNYRPVCVAQRVDGATLREALALAVRSRPIEYWDEAHARGDLLDAQRRPADPARIVRAGERYLHRFAQEVEPPVSADLQLLYEDEALVVLHKPAPLPMHPGGRFRRNTVQHVLAMLYAPQKPRPAHRLDADTTGVVVAARTRHFAGLLQPQFARGEVEKHYLARVVGHPAADAFDCDAPLARQPEEEGLRAVDVEQGAAARTRFRVLRRFDDGTTLLAVQPLTGRTHQIRLHCAHLGLPVVGDALYGFGAKAGESLCLHAWGIRLRHPATGERVSFAAAAPAWAGPLAGSLPD